MVTINRKELYTKVWETPITRLSKEYGLSDVGFAKICIKGDHGAVLLIPVGNV